MRLASFFDFLKDIKFSHSIFALPFVGTGIIIGQLPFPSFSQLFFLLLCMVSARSFAMGMNRCLDWKIDKLNPRTSTRLIPLGVLEAKESLLWSLAMGSIFVFSAWGLNPLAGKCSIPVLLILGTYPLMKRLSHFTHWYLGMCLGLAPIAANVALKGSVSLAVLAIGLGVALWTAGFDLIYALQDRDFDVDYGLKSYPARMGIGKTLKASRLCFTATVVLFLFAGWLAGMGSVFFFGVMAAALILVYEHWLVRESEHKVLSGAIINSAFFYGNAAFSILIYLATQSDVLWR